MTQQHPITPPADLVLQWQKASKTDNGEFLPFVFATLAAQWGADQELDACREWLFKDPATHDLVGREARYLDLELCAARRHKPPTRKQRALKGLAVMIKNGHLAPDLAAEIRTVLEMAPDE